MEKGGEDLKKEVSEILFEAKDISKHFGPTVALNHVSFSVKRGEIHGLIGENGSGKSTMSSIVSGMQKPDGGQMVFCGKEHKPASMLEGAALGVGMIFQESGVVLGITVAENLFLGNLKQFRKWGVVNKKEMYRVARKALDQIGFTEISPEMMIDQLNMEDRKLVEVCKVMYNQPELLIVDETTTALSQHGRDRIYSIMRRMKEEGKSVLFISHDLEELMNTCDRLTVLRDGQLITTIEKEDMEENAIKQHMVGREVSDRYYREDYGKKISDEVVLRVNNVTTGYGMLQNCSLELHRGELLGIGGLSHSGMHELAQAIFGQAATVTGEVIHVASGEQIKNPAQAIAHGMGYVSKDRDKDALILGASIKDNIVSAGLDKLANKLSVISPAKEKQYVNEQIDLLSIKCENMEQFVQYLSGGNKQKVSVAKWVGRGSEILILDCPTRGVDIGVKAAMYRLMEDMLAEGKSILLISEELTELIGMSDRILILKDGEIVKEILRSPTLTESDIIDVMI